MASNYKHLSTPLLLNKEFVRLSSHKNTYNDFEKLYKGRQWKIRVNFEYIMKVAIKNNNLEIVKFLHEHQFKNLDFITNNEMFIVLTFGYLDMLKYLLDAKSSKESFVNDIRDTGKVEYIFKQLLTKKKYDMVKYVVVDLLEKQDNYNSKFTIIHRDYLFYEMWKGNHTELYEWFNLNLFNGLANLITPSMILSNFKNLDNLFNFIFEHKLELLVQVFNIIFKYSYIIDTVYYMKYLNKYSTLLNQYCEVVEEPTVISSLKEHQFNYFQNRFFTIDRILLNKNIPNNVFKYLLKNYIKKYLDVKVGTGYELDLRKILNFACKKSINDDLLIKDIFNLYYNSKSIKYTINILYDLFYYNLSIDVFNYIYNRLANYYIKNNNIIEFYSSYLPILSIIRLIKTNNYKLVINFINLLSSKKEYLKNFKVNENQLENLITNKYISLKDEFLYLNLYNILIKLIMIIAYKYNKTSIISYLYNLDSNIKINYSSLIYIYNNNVIYLYNLMRDNEKDIIYKGDKYKINEFIMYNIVSNKFNVINFDSDNKFHIYNLFTSYKYKDIYQYLINNSKHSLFMNGKIDNILYNLDHICFINILELYFKYNSEKYKMSKYLLKIIKTLLSLNKYSKLNYLINKFNTSIYFLMNNINLLYKYIHLEMTSYINYKDKYIKNFELDENEKYINNLLQYLIEEKSTFIEKNKNNLFLCAYKSQNLIIMDKIKNKLNIEDEFILKQDYNDIIINYNFNSNFESALVYITLISYLYYNNKINDDYISRLYVDKYNRIIYSENHNVSYDCITLCEKICKILINHQKSEFTKDNRYKTVLNLIKDLDKKNKKYVLIIENDILIEYFIINSIIQAYNDKDFSTLINELNYTKISEFKYDKDDMCSICFDNINELEYIVIFNNCNHYLCIDCFMKSFYMINYKKEVKEKHYNCMICRQKNTYNCCSYYKIDDKND